MGKIENDAWIVETGDILFVYRALENKNYAGATSIEDEYLVFDEDDGIEIPENGVFHGHKRKSSEELKAYKGREVQIEDWTRRHSKYPRGYIGILKVNKFGQLVVRPRPRPEEEGQPVQATDFVEIGPIEVQETAQEVSAELVAEPASQELDLKRD